MVEIRDKDRLYKKYNEEVRPALVGALGLHNIMEVPKIEKVVLNVGIKDAVADSGNVKYVFEVIGKIAGQLPVKTKAKNSIAGFKLREGMPIGVKVTLRGKKMFMFLDKLISLALPKERDFHGIPRKLDGRGNYNLGIREWVIFPELDVASIEKSYGVNITVQTSAKSDEHAFELLKMLGFPFRAAGA